MEFWRIYRLIFAKRYLILGMMALSAVVIFLGTQVQTQKREYQADAILQPEEVSKPSEIVTSMSDHPSLSVSDQVQDTQTRISTLITLLRSSNDLYVKTADLLREDETMRALDVERILDQNGYFTSLDTEIASQATADVRAGTLKDSEKDHWITVSQQSARKKVAERFARGEDASGSFAETGLKQSESDIVERIRKYIAFDTVLGPLSTDTTPQIANQIKVTGNFEREAEAKLYVNLICVEFLDYYTNQQTTGMTTRISLLKTQRQEVNSRLQRARRDKVDFLNANKTNMEIDGVMTQLAQTEAQRNAAEAEVSSANGAVAILEAAVRSAPAVRSVALPAGENPEVKKLQDQVDDARIAFETIRAGNDGENSDRYKAAKARLDTAVDALNEAIKRGYSTTTASTTIDAQQAQLTQALSQQSQAVQRLGVLNQQLAEQQQRQANVPAAQAKLRDLDREIALDEQNDSSLAATIAKLQTDIINNGKAGSIYIVSEAHAMPVVSAIAAQRVKLIVYGVVLALIFGVVLVIVMDTLDHSIRTGEDLEKLTGLPIAGVIPEHLPDPVRSPRLALLEPMSPAAEAYRLLRTDLLFTANERPFQSLIAATAKPEQGATTTLCNLAIVLAQVGRRVALVDADLRHPKLHRIFKISNEIGLTSVLAEQNTLDEALVQTEVENLMLLASGPNVANPTDVLESRRMQALHEELKQRFDYVLFDTPAAIAFSDTAILSSYVDATLMVVRANSVPQGTEDQVRILLNKARANVIGAVLNGVSPELVDSVKYHSGGGYTALPPPATNNTTGGATPKRDFPVALPSSTSPYTNSRTNGAGNGTGNGVGHGLGSGSSDGFAIHLPDEEPEDHPSLEASDPTVYDRTFDDERDIARDFDTEYEAEKEDERNEPPTRNGSGGSGGIGGSNGTGGAGGTAVKQRVVVPAVSTLPQPVAADSNQFPVARVTEETRNPFKGARSEFVLPEPEQTYRHYSPESSSTAKPQGFRITLRGVLMVLIPGIIVGLMVMLLSNGIGVK